MSARAGVLAAFALSGLIACGPASSSDAGADGGTVTTHEPHHWDLHRFATSVVSFTPGDHAGYGQSQMPGVVEGPPIGGGDAAGSVDVVSLGDEGSIVVGFDDDIVDGPGPDLIVFENVFSGFVETGRVSASEDGVTFVPWSCDAASADHAGCAGLRPVFSNWRTNDIDPTDPNVAGGDAFDLSDIGLQRAKFIRIEDTGLNQYEGTSGGFDLDAVAIVNTDPMSP